jgi:protein-tyrosine phosphatase
MGKVFKMLELTGSSRDVADPWFTGNFEATYEDVLAGCTVILESIRKDRS